MKATLSLLAFALMSLPPAVATHCPAVTVSDDGTHSVTQDRTDVVVNGAGVSVTCFGFTADTAETISLNGTQCRTLQRLGDGVHSVTESAMTVYVNGVGMKFDCIVTPVVPEHFHLP